MKRVLAVLLTILLIFGLMPSMAVAESLPEFAGGNGTEEDPYLISTKYHLDNVRNHLDAHFKMMNDIEFSDADFSEDGEFYNYKRGFLPIGDKYAPFTGVFDGNGNAIKNIYIHVRGSGGNVGLFRSNSGTVKNLGMQNGILRTTWEPYMRNGFFVGSIAARNEGAILNCYNTGEITSFDYAGGIAAVNNGTIVGCYNMADISGVAIGGIVYDNNGVVSNCYNTATLNRGGTGNMGGIAAYNSATIENCYNAGCVTLNGIVSFNEGEIQSCYYIETSQNGAGGYVEDTTKKCTAEELTKQETFVGFDFENIWTFDSTLKSYPAPVLKNVKHIESITEENETEFAGGFGNCFYPFLISAPKHLDNVRHYLSSVFKMKTDVVFCDADFADNGDFYNNGAGFIPIATDDDEFTGIFYGNGKTIKNLYISDTVNAYVGLFGGNGGRIEDLTVQGNVSGTELAGGIVGYNSGNVIDCQNNANVSGQWCGGMAGGNSVGTIVNCYNTGKITATEYGGGIAGRNIYASITKCYNLGEVSGEIAGGIVGSNHDQVNECYNEGNIDATEDAGGIVGHGGIQNSILTDCYNTGNITAGKNSGGIAGSNELNHIGHCYNSGTVTCTDLGNNTSAGGIAGGIDTFAYDDDSGSISDCFNEGKVSNADYVGGIMGYSGGHIEKSYNKGEISGPNVIGGVVGNNSGEISNCYNIGGVSGADYGGANSAGGIVGDNKGDVRNCYNTAKVLQSYGNGAIAGDNSGAITNAYYLNNMERGVGYGDDATVKCSVKQMKKEATYVGFDFEENWAFDTTQQPYPILRGAHYHNFGEYVYNNDATATKDGTKTRTCLDCGHSETVKATGTKWKNPFTDIKTKDFYYTPVLWAVNRGITSGTSPTTFAPKEACTRGQIVAFLWRAAGSPKPQSSHNPFTDVKKSDYYYKAVLWAVENGITAGSTPTTFAPKEACTRGQIVAFLWRAAGTPKPQSSHNPFTDVKKSDYYYKAVLWAVENGITAGSTPTTFAPQAPCTRGQIAAFLYRYYN